MSDLVRFSIEDGVATALMDDGKANALSDAMMDGLLAALTRSEAEATSLVIAGRPDRFCAGFDLRVMMSGKDAAAGMLRKGSDLLMRLYGSPIPIVAACTGHALAGGALMLCTTDVRFGTDGPYKLGLNEVAIGLPVPILAMELARDRLAPQEFTRGTLFAQIYDPAGAVKAGYLDSLVEREDLLGKAQAEAKRLGALSRTAYSASKERMRGRTIKMIRETLESDLSTLLGA